MTAPVRLTRVSGSKIGLLMVCAYPFAPGVEWREDGDPERQAVGNAFHDIVQDRLEVSRPLLKIGIDQACEKHGVHPDDRDEVAALVASWEEAVKDLDTSQWRAEVAFAFDPYTLGARELGQNIGREYEKHGKLPHEIGVSIDVGFTTLEDLEGVAHVYDWKTGRQTALERAKTNWQLSIGAYCLARVYECDRCVVATWHVRTDGVWTDFAEYSFGEALARARQIADREALAHGKPTPVPGSHCAEKWCQARGVSCPVSIEATTELVALAESPPPPVDDAGDLADPFDDLADPFGDDPLAANLAAAADRDIVAAPRETFPLVVKSSAIRSPEHAREVYLKCKAASAMLDTVKSALDEYADRQPFRVDKKWYAAVQNRTEKIVVNDEAERVFAELLGEHAASIVQVKKSATKEALKVATAASAGKGKARVALEKTVLAKLAEVGAIKVSEFVTHELVDRKDEEAAE